MSSSTSSAAFVAARRSVQWLISRRCLVHSHRVGTRSIATPATGSLQWKAAATTNPQYDLNKSTNSSVLLFPQQQRVSWFSTTTSTSTTASDSEGEEEEEARYFSDLSDLHPNTLDLLDGQGFKTMTEIQAKTWDAVSQGKDVVGRSRTGSGKTLAFLLPTMERISNDMEQGNTSASDVRMLIISPTRELASQIHNTAEDLVRAYTSRRRGGSNNMNCQVLYGGVSKQNDLRRMDMQIPTVLTATPGRLLDHLQSSNLYGLRMSVADLMTNIDVLVLDEMDRLLDMGFRDDIQRIISYLPPKTERQTLLFSATVPPSVKHEIRECLQRDYLTVDCIQEDDPSTHVVNTVQQSHVVIDGTKSISGVVTLIEHLMQTSTNAKLIVFFNTTCQVAFFASLFQASGRRGGHYDIMELHSKISQAGRSRTSDQFRNARGNAILFTSDVSARGVDYPDVTHVIQIGSANDRETYIHRLGRTARAGKSGEGILVLMPEEIQPVLRSDLRGIDIPENKQLQELIDADDDDDDTSTNWLPRALNDYEVNDKARDCYRGLFGFYWQRLNALGIRSPGDMAVDMITAFADEAGLHERPGLPGGLVRQFGLENHPDINIGRSGGGGYGGGGYGGGGGRRGSFGGGGQRDDGYGYGGRGGGGGRGRGRSGRGGGGGRGRWDDDDDEDLGFGGGFDRRGGGGRASRSGGGRSGWDDDDEDLGFGGGFDRRRGGGSRASRMDRGRGGGGVGRNRVFGRRDRYSNNDDYDDDYDNDNLFGNNSRSNSRSNGRSNSSGSSNRNMDDDDAAGFNDFLSAIRNKRRGD